MFQPDTVLVLEQCEADAARLRAARPLNPDVLAKIRDHLRIMLTYTSNAIEGNTLTWQETMVALEGQTVGGKSIREHLEAVDHAAAFDYVWDLATKSEPLTANEIRSVQALVTHHTLSSGSGAWRTVGVRISGSAHVPPDALDVPVLMDQWIQQFTTSLAGPAIVNAARLHSGFVDIHPFLDGNGRTARLLTHLDLVRHGYLPALLLPTDRLTYYQALEEARAGRWDRIVQHFAVAVHRSYVRFWEPYLPPETPKRKPGLSV